MVQTMWGYPTADLIKGINDENIWIVPKPKLLWYLFHGIRAMVLNASLINYKVIIYRFITISRDTKKILGDTMSTQVYLANRLNTTPEAVEDMCSRIHALKRIRVTKVHVYIFYKEHKTSYFKWYLKLYLSSSKVRALWNFYYFNPAA